MSVTINNSVSEQQLSLVLAADRNVIYGLLVAIVSSLAHLNKQYSLKCYILAIALTDAEKASITEWLSPFTPRLELKFIDIEEQVISELYTYGRFSSAIYARYFTAELIPEATYPIYIDTDIIVQCDLSSLLTEFNPSMAAAAVAEGTIGDFMSDELINLYHLQKSHPYLNSGFMVINAPLWRKEKYAEKLLAITKQSGNKTRSPDQEVFNILFRNNWQAISRKWNTLLFLNPHNPVDLPKEKVNIHTVAQYKPWEFKKSGSKGVVKEFYKYLSQTKVPWADCPGSYIQYQNRWWRKFNHLSTKLLQHQS